MSVRELYNSLVSALNYGGLKDARDGDDNIVISDSTLLSLLPQKFKKIQHDTRSCVVVNVAFLIKVYIHHFFSSVIGIKKTER